MSVPPFQLGERITAGTLYRRVPPDPAYWSRKRQWPTEYNFKPAAQHEHLSMHLSNLISPEEIFASFATFGLLEIPVEALTELELSATYHGLEGRDHVAVWGLKGADANRLGRLLRKKIIRAWEPGTHAIRTAPTEIPPGS